jgi:gag-polypeptide of LTR copia-type
MQKLRSIANELSFIGFPVSDDDLATFALTGLGSDFNAFVVAATTASRQASLSFADLHSLLLSHEALLLSQNSGQSYLPSSQNPVAFYASNNKHNRVHPKTRYGSHNGFRSPNLNPHSNLYRQTGTQSET